MKAVLACLLLYPLFLQAEEGIRTLRSFGAVGDGRTDDRAALQTAFRVADGAPLDGEGRTYAIRGSLDISVSVDLRRSAFMQILPHVDTSKYIRSARSSSAPTVNPPGEEVKMVAGLLRLSANAEASYPEDPVLSGDDLATVMAMTHVRTVFIHGTADRKVSVKLSNIAVNLGADPRSGSRTDSAGLYVTHAGPVQLSDVEVTGQGKGRGIWIVNSSDVKLTRLHVHDITWALFDGDLEPSLDSLKQDFRWNNNPIYEFRNDQRKFIRVRVQEQLNGIVLTALQNVELTDSRVERLKCQIGGTKLSWQMDGISVAGVKNIVIRNCQISEVWEGIDMTGRGVDGFVQENITITDALCHAFKYAHPQRNGQVVNCTAVRAGLDGFTIGSEADHIEYTKCQALETGAQNTWKDASGKSLNAVAAFRICGDAGGPAARHITLTDCRAVNKISPGAMDYGFLCERPAAPLAQNNRLINPIVQGARLAPLSGFPPTDPVR